MLDLSSDANLSEDFLIWREFFRIRKRKSPNQNNGKTVLGQEVLTPIVVL